MRIKLFTHDMELITTIELPKWAWSQLERCGVFHLPVPALTSEYSHLKAHLTAPPKTVSIYTDKLTEKRKFFLLDSTGEDLHLSFLYTTDEDDLMLLKAAFLPSQTENTQGLESVAHPRGFFHPIPV